ncbi:MAG: methyl-accepting chemotaxis protein [Pseudanabaena sp.]|nr:MAG: methyl-accepting chemotaxis protein [Pseudanabaena sp.]
MVLESPSRIDSPETIDSKEPSQNTNPPTGANSFRTRSTKDKSIVTWWQSLGLRTKATTISLIAIAVPLIAIGGFTYYYVGQNIFDLSKQAKTSSTKSMAFRVAYFMQERFGDIQVLSELPFLTNSKLLSIADQKASLDTFLKSSNVYDSIAVYRLDGSLIVDASLEPAPANIANRPYFQTVLSTDKPFISQPEASVVTKKVSLFTAAPIKDATGKTIAVVRSRVQITALQDILKDFGENGDQFHLADSSGKFFATLEKDRIGRDLKNDFPGLDSLIAKRESSASRTIDLLSSKESFAGYAPLPKLEGLPDLNWDTVIEVDADIANRPLQQLLVILVAATGTISILGALLAILIARRATRPIIEATDAVVELGKGNLDTRLTVKGQDELAQLGDNINSMAGQLQEFIALQEEQTQQSRIMADKERQRSESIQRELITLLSDVEGAANGDLTVRAQISEGEIGIVADFFNAIVESLRDIVTQVKQAALQVSTSVSTNNDSIRNLAKDASLQTEQLEEALQSVENMTESIQQVASSAQEAADASNEAAATAEVGSIAIEQSADSILQLRQTVSETAKKVKRLGEASQQISKVVVLIDQIALKTNMLAVNASIEAARAGEEGRGFAVVAEEVGSLAAQSATATKDIARIVESIQQETSEVVESMEASTLQVVEGTNKVEEARKSLSQIVEVARKVNELFQGISLATTSQVQTSQSVKSVMESISSQSQKSSETSREVAIALQETANVASKLQASVETFKVEAA